MLDQAKVLVTGGSGFIGSNLIRKLSAIPAITILNVDCLTYAGNTKNLLKLEHLPNYHFVKQDLRDFKNLAQIVENFDPDLVFHLAAESHVDRSIDSPIDFLQTNVNGTFNLLEACRNTVMQGPKTRSKSFRFIHVSTDEVFGSLGPTSLPFTEESQYQPNSPYAASKASSDHLVRAWNKTYGLPTLISNCSNNFGPYQSPEKLIPSTIVKALLNKPISVYGDGTQIRDWLFVEDHCDALILIAKHGIVGESYNVGGAFELQNIDLVRQICVALSDEVKTTNLYEDLITFVADRPGHDKRYSINAEKIRALGWCQNGNFDQALNKTVRWYIENEDWWRNTVEFGGMLQRFGIIK